MPVLIVIGLNEFGDNDCDLLAGKLLVIFLHEMLNQLPVILLKDQIVEHEMVDGLVDLGKQPLDLLPRNHEVLVHHFFEISALLVGRVQVLTDNMPNLFERQDVMSPLIFLMVADAALDLANGGLIGTGQATAHLHHSVLVDSAEELLVLGMPEQHLKLNYNIIRIMSLELAASEEEGRRIGNFTLGKTIGQGTFNKVKIARHIHSKEQVAIKLIDKGKIKSTADHQRLIKQLKILRKVRHPNIIQLYEILQDQHYYYVVTEYASRGELFDQIVKQQKLSEFVACKYLQQILSAVQYLQEMGVVHRDLKPQNVLLDYKFNVKIIDFGLSNIYSKGETLRTACGSPCYAAPQMLSGEVYDPSKIDIWSSGIILYAMCFGFLPFDHSNSAELYDMIKAGKYEVPQHASESLISILSRILQVSPQKRASIQEIRQHAFSKFFPDCRTSGIIPGLSIIPFQQHIQTQMKELGIDSSDLRHQITNNKHTQLTSTYYLLLHQWLRQKNQSILTYYNSKSNLINRYKVIERVKEMYDKRVTLKLEELSKSRRNMNGRSTSGQKKRSKTSQKKTKTRTQSISKFNSRQLYLSPQRKRKSRPEGSSKSQPRKSNKKLKRN